jgi:predicted SnoaL-like aldol condensation-catalyzing enzyme
MKPVETLLQITNEVFSLPNIKDSCRQLQYIEARSVAYALLRNILGYTYTEIGREFKRNHATILHSYNNFPYLTKHNPMVQDKYDTILMNWITICHDLSDKVPNKYQNVLRNLEEQNKMLILSHNTLQKKIKLMVWAHEDRADCNYSIEDVDTIVSNKSWSRKRRIDTLLHIDCSMYSNLGLDSSIKERNEVKQKSRVIYRTIKTLDEGAGKLFLQSMD